MEIARGDGIANAAWDGGCHGTVVACLRPFIEHLAASSLSPTTIRRHVDNLWTLGGEVIRDLHYDPSLRKRAADRLLRDANDARDGHDLIAGRGERVFPDA